MTTGDCYGQRPHLPAVTRRDGSVWCARCGVQLQPPNKRRAWGKGEIPTPSWKSRLRTFHGYGAPLQGITRAIGGQKISSVVCVGVGAQLGDEN